MTAAETRRAPAATGAGAADERFVLLGFPDLQGAIRGKALRPKAFEAALREGAMMTDLLLALDPVDQPITTYESFGLRSGAGDLLVRPDQSTLHELAWRPGWSVCLATPSWRDGRRCEIAPREALRHALEGIGELGYDVVAAFEYELRVRDAEGEPLSRSISYSATEIGRFDELIEHLLPALEALDIELSAVHTEAGPGLLELNLGARPGLRAADDATFAKLAVKEVAASLGLQASFLAKTTPGEEGSSGHIHLSCWSDGANAFAPDADGAGPPTTCASAIAGMLAHLPACSLALNPTINSYKRLVPGFFAPVNVSWGDENRSAALRFIGSHEPGRCRVECRRPGSDANPYIALSALVAAAADGIRGGARPPAPVSGDASESRELQALPGSLESALAAWREDGALRELLGGEFSDYYATSRQWELDAWRDAVSDWERDRYERAV